MCGSPAQEATYPTQTGMDSGISTLEVVGKLFEDIFVSVVGYAVGVELGISVGNAEGASVGNDVGLEVVGADVGQTQTHPFLSMTCFVSSPDTTVRAMI